MSQDILNEILDVIKRRTGYLVSVTPQTGLHTMASMITASTKTPTHIIFINPKFDNISNYLVALQCHMLLEKWDKNGTVYNFTVFNNIINSKVETIINQINANISDEQKKLLANQIITGLLQQLNSLPCEIYAADACFDNYPSLREEQSIMVNEQLKMNSASLAPNIRNMIPVDIYQKNATMNAAYALWWSKLVNDSSTLLPYKASGCLQGGEELLEILNKNNNNLSSRYRSTVDEWAKHLNLTEYYDWIKRKGQ